MFPAFAVAVSACEYCPFELVLVYKVYVKLSPSASFAFACTVIEFVVFELKVTVGASGAVLVITSIGEFCVDTIFPATSYTST